MSEPFNVNQYWLERGQGYVREGLAHEFHLLQERFLLEILRASRLPMGRLLEIGCGFGRITRLLAETFADAHITAVDLSPDQLLNARSYCRLSPNISFQLFDIYSGAPFPAADYDTVVAVEVFLHHPAPVVASLVERLSRVTQHLVNIDWSEEWRWKTPEHVWVHDYRALYAQAGLQCATFVLPEKVDGLQQKLFIAAKQLSPALVRLEKEIQLSKAQSASAAVPSPSDGLPQAASWPEQLEQAVQEIRETIPVGATFILVDESQWDYQPRAFRGYRVLPFLEHDGQYWGPPADDATALRELQRLCRAGASHIVVAWPSFWWLDYYSGLREHLHGAGVCIRQNERVVIFRLPPG